METTSTRSSYGLPSDMAAAYDFLLQNAPQKASAVAKALSIQRPTAYLLLEKLIEENLVAKHKQKGSAAVYVPLHPLYLQTVIEKRIRAAEQQKLLLGNALPSLISQYHLRFGGIPGFRVFAGKEGIVELYEDILNEKKDILLIRSLHDRRNSLTADLITPQMVAQVEAGISVRSIDPYDESIPKNVDEYDARYNIKRRIVRRETYDSPAQILIYANKIAITSFGETLVTTIIDDKFIHDTLASMFEYIWKNAEQEDAELRERVKMTHTQSR